MAFGVEDVLVQRQHVLVVRQEEVQILKGFSQEERLHHVSKFSASVARPVLLGLLVRDGNLLHVIHGGIAVLHSRVLLDRFERGPTPLLVLLLARQSVHVEPCFECFRPQ